MPPRPGRFRRRLAAALLATAALAAAACGGDDDASADSGSGTARGQEASAASTDDGAFPVTITHAFGETEITEAPERVVTWGWASADAAIALGVVPVAIPFEEYGGDGEGVLPWIRQALEDQGAELPTILPNADEAPFEAIAAARPDLILAPYSGITQDEYDLLAEIAPVVAYPGEAWATPWRETIEIVGTALGRSDAAAELLDEIDAEFAAAAEAHPELEGKTVAMVWDAAGDFYVYKPADARVEAAEALGLVSAPSVDALSTDEATFYFTLSYERLDELDSDIVVNFADTADASAAFLASPPAQLMEQVQHGAVAEIVGAELIASVSPPTALSLTWGLEDYVAALSAAARAADGAAGAE